MNGWRISFLFKLIFLLSNIIFCSNNATANEFGKKWSPKDFIVVYKKNVSDDVAEDIKPLFLEDAPLNEIPESDRLEVENGKSYAVDYRKAPFRKMGALSINRLFKSKTKGGLIRCSGQFIKSNLVLTAAHCLENIKSDQQAKYIAFHRAMHPKNDKNKSGISAWNFGWKCFGFARNWITQSDPDKLIQWDFAIVKVRPITTGGALELRYFGDEMVESLPVMAVGYPKNSGNKYRMTAVNGSLTQLDASESPNVFRMSDNPFNQGASGGAILDSKNRIVSIASNIDQGDDTVEGPKFQKNVMEALIDLVGGC
ncbi:MAG: trypsin-like peptidase domain-containing protein [Pseudomonadota bacterium]